MREVLILILALTLYPGPTQKAPRHIPPSGSKLGSVAGGEFKEAHVLIEKKCVSCHNDERIWVAMSQGKDMRAIQRRMEQKGVRLSADQQGVLGIFWKETPLKERKAR